MKKSGMLRLVICLLLGSLLSSCVSFPALKNISPEVKAGFKRVGVVVLISDLVPSYELSREKDFWGYEIKVATNMRIFDMAQGALDQAVTGAVSSRFGSGVTVVSIPTTQDEKEIAWDSLYYLAAKNRLLDRLREISAQNKLDLIVLVRQHRSQPEGVLGERDFSGLLQTYLANKDKSGGSYNIMTSMVVELFDGKNLKSLDLQFIYGSPVSPSHETPYGREEFLRQQRNPEISQNIAMGVGKRVASALEHLGF